MFSKWQSFCRGELTMVRQPKPMKNILNVLDRATEENRNEGLEWYINANKIARAVGTIVSSSSAIRIQTIIGAGILSALSPQTNWDLNIAKAFSFAEAYQRPTFTTTSNYQKALNVVTMLDSAIQSGDPLLYVENLMGKVAPKQKAFYRNIVDPAGDYIPTIDRHAIGIYLDRKPSKEDIRRYGTGNALQDVINTYVTASKLADLHYNELQAITWLQWRSE